MNRKYPRFGEVMRQPNPKALPGSGKPCIVCGEFTTGKAAVQVSHFRGDDVVVSACKDHLRKGSEICAAYIATTQQHEERNDG